MWKDCAEGDCTGEEGGEVYWLEVNWLEVNSLEMGGVLGIEAME